MTLVDSSVLIGWIYADDALHGACVAALDAEIAERRSLALSAITWMEVLTGTGDDDTARTAAEQFIADAKATIVDVDRATAEHAAALRRRHRRRDGSALSAADALILATGAVGREIDRVLTADARWRGAHVAGARVRIVRAR